MRHFFADCILDESRHELVRAGAVVPVEPQVFDLLALLARNAERLVTRDEIVEAVWGGRIVSESAISARIAAARKAVGDDGKRQAVIRTVARRGLQMVATVKGGSSDAVSTGDKDATADLPHRPEPDTQAVRYARNAAGQSLAYVLSGNGPPLVRLGYNLTHLDEEWRVAGERLYFETLGAGNRLLRFDPVGVGLSEADSAPVDFDRAAEDAVAVADAAGFDRFAVLANSGGVLPAVRLAAHYPDRVRRLIIVGGYAEGRARREPDPEPDAIRSVIAEGWGRPDGAFSLAYLMAYFPEGPLEAIKGFQRITQASCGRDQALRIRDASNNDYILDLLPQIRCPTLILHSRHDGVHPLSQAQKLAAGIPDARLVVLESANLQPLPGQPEWPRMMRAMLDFLAG